MTKEEIKDYLDVTPEEDIIDHIYYLENELIKTQEALEVSRELILKGSVSKERYNDIVKKYNDLLRRKK